MGKFFRNLDFTWFSFLVGFLAGGLFWWLMGKLRPNIGQVRTTVTTQIQTTQKTKVVTGETRLCNDIIRFAQGMHIAAPLFSLDEVQIPIRLLPPPQEPIYNEELLPVADITDSAIPYLPDWPEFASLYNTPTMSMAEALHGDAHLVVIGPPGSGKTVTLAQLATQAAKHDPELGKIAAATPVLVRASDLPLPLGDTEDLLSPLITAIQVYAAPKTASRLPAILKTAFEDNSILLMVDGLDEFPPNEFDQVVTYFDHLLQVYPSTRIVTSASLQYLGRLLSLDFFPMVLTNWNQEQRAEFLNRWGALWTSLISKDEDQTRAKEGESTDPLLIHGWLLNTTNLLTPLELTLKTWAAYAGDTLGPRSIDDIEAYIRRMTFEQPPVNRPAFAQMCSQVVLTMQPSVSNRSANQWLAGGGAEVPLEALDVSEESIDAKSSLSARKKVRAPGALTDLIESGLVREHPGERVSVINPVISGYLASQALANTQAGEQLLTQPDWTGKILTLQYLATQDSQSPWVNQMLIDEKTDPLLHTMLNASRWLRLAPDKAEWSAKIMRSLATSLQKDNLAFGLRARIVTALVSSGDSGVNVLLRQMLESPEAALRQLAALGAGILRDTKSIPELSKLIKDPSPSVSRAAILSLVNIGDKQTLELVAYTLIHGDESLRQAAAEGLANNVEEGHPTLREGSEYNDHAVRRAVVFGLARVNTPWAVEILQELRTKDEQWVVQDAASHVLDEMERPNPRIPHRLSPLPQTAWLIEFAGKRGIGVAPGKPAYALIYSALREGNEEEKLAALYYLCYHGDESSLLPLYKTYYANTGEIREVALNTLWHLSSSGVSLPPPIQYDLQ